MTDPENFRSVVSVGWVKLRLRYRVRFVERPTVGGSEVCARPLVHIYFMRDFIHYVA